MICTRFLVSCFHIANGNSGGMSCDLAKHQNSIESISYVSNTWRPLVGFGIIAMEKKNVPNFESPGKPDFYFNSTDRFIF